MELGFLGGLYSIITSEALTTAAVLLKTKPRRPDERTTGFLLWRVELLRYSHRLFPIERLVLADGGGGFDLHAGFFLHVAEVAFKRTVALADGLDRKSVV